MDRALNFWGRKAFPAVAARGEGVMETFVAVVQDMLAAIAVKYNLKEKGLDPAVVPEVVGQAFSALLKKMPAPQPGAPTTGSPARVILAQTPDAEPIYPLQTGPEASPVSEELLHRAIRSNVELAEALSDLVRDMNLGLGTILSHADLLLSYRDEAKRTAAIGEIQKEASRLRQRMQELGRVAAHQSGRPGTSPGQQGRPGTSPGGRPATSPGHRPAPAPLPPLPPPASRPAPAPVARPTAVLPMPVPPGAGLDHVIAEAVAASREVLEARRVAVDSRVVPGTPPPRCPPANLRRAAAAFLNGLALVCPPGSSIVIRSERKPVLLRSKDGEVKRDFLMLALAHAAGLLPEDQQRILQGGDPGPLGEAYRLVKEVGGFTRFAPLPGGTLETRVFLPAV